MDNFDIIDWRILFWATNLKADSVCCEVVEGYILVVGIDVY